MFVCNVYCKDVDSISHIQYKNKKKASNSWKPRKSSCIICRQTISTQLIKIHAQFYEVLLQYVLVVVYEAF